MKNKILQTFLFLVGFTFATQAQDFSIDGINYTITNATDYKVAIQEGSCYEGDLVLFIIVKA